MKTAVQVVTRRDGGFELLRTISVMSSGPLRVGGVKQAGVILDADDCEVQAASACLWENGWKILVPPAAAGAVSCACCGEARCSGGVPGQRPCTGCYRKFVAATAQGGGCEIVCKICPAYDWQSQMAPQTLVRAEPNDQVLSWESNVTVTPLLRRAPESTTPKAKLVRGVKAFGTTWR